MGTWKIIEHEILDSTNLEARRLIDTSTGQESVFCLCEGAQSVTAEQMPQPAYANTVILAHEQTAGRGRRGREWSSPRGDNLYFSLILCPELFAEECSALTLVMGLAVAESVRGLTGTEALIKWPNDIVIDGKKVCGILAEMVLEGNAPKAVIMGVGVNVGARVFPAELAQTATDLEQQCGRRISATRLLEDSLESFANYYQIYCRTRSMDSLLETYNALLVNRDRQVCVLEPTGNYNGIARGINERGELLVELPDGQVKAVYAGEVSVRGIYGYV